MKNKFGLLKLGKNVTIYEYVKLINPKLISIGDCSMIDDFVLIHGGRDKGITIGRYVHVASFTSITGGGNTLIEDYVGIASGVRLINGTNTYKEGKRMTACLPLKYQGVMRGEIVIKKDAFIGSNTVVHPNVTIGEGAVVGSNSLVLKDIEPWSINVGSPCKKIGERPKVITPDIKA